MTYDEYKALWAKKTTKQVEKELASMRRYCDKYSAAYSWHGKQITPPGNVPDGDKIIALKEILETKQGESK